MSGQPVKTQADINKFRNEYMENLALEERINDMNLQANKTYLLTGQLPPSSQMMDTRTNAEKLADIEGMKRKIADDLRPIAEPSFAIAIVNKITESPLNADGGLLRFLAQRAQSIAENLKTQYSIGIAGDLNDVERIVDAIKKMYSDMSSKFQSTKSYFNSQSSGSSRSGIIGSNDIDKIIMELQDVIKQLQITRISVLSGNRLKSLMEKLIKLKSILPSTNEMQELLNVSEKEILFRDETAKILKTFFDFIEKLPKYEEVNTILDKIKRYTTSNNTKNIDRLIKGLIELFSVLDSDEFNKFIPLIGELKQQLKLILDEKNNLLRREYERVNNDRDEERRRAEHAQRVLIVNPADDEAYVRFGNNAPNFGSVNYIPSSASLPTSGNGIKRRGRPRGTGIVRQPRPSAYVGFGINEINQKKLKDNILTVRRNTRSTYNDMPSRHVSNNFKNIMNSIIGGGVPKFEDLNKLDNEEKDYLYKLVNRSNMEDRLTIPAPSKDQQEKDIHNFEVLKGQIMSGNDSQELVKKFKILILKLVRQGLLPKNESNDLLQALIELGY